MYKIFHNAQTQVPRRFLTQYMIVVDRYSNGVVVVRNFFCDAEQKGSSSPHTMTTLLCPVVARVASLLYSVQGVDAIEEIGKIVGASNSACPCHTSKISYKIPAPHENPTMAMGLYFSIAFVTIRTESRTAY